MADLRAVPPVLGPLISNASRARIIADLLRERLAANPNTLVVLIGAGFDSRAFRLTGGRWLEVDEPQVFAWKEPRLPEAESANALTRLPVDFSTEKLVDRLKSFADAGPVVVIVEGVLMYLDEPRIRDLLQTIRATDGLNTPKSSALLSGDQTGPALSSVLSIRRATGSAGRCSRRRRSGECRPAT